MVVKAKAQAGSFEIPALSIGVMELTLIGDSPLIVHKWSEKARQAAAWWGLARRGRLGRVWRGNRGGVVSGPELCGRDWRGRYGKAGSGQVSSGVAWCGRRGTSGFGSFGNGLAWRCWAGKEW